MPLMLWTALNADETASESSGFSSSRKSIVSRSSRCLAVSDWNFFFISGVMISLKGIILVPLFLVLLKMRRPF